MGVPFRMPGGSGPANGRESTADENVSVSEAARGVVDESVESKEYGCSAPETGSPR